MYAHAIKILQIKSQRISSSLLSKPSLCVCATHREQHVILLYDNGECGELADEADCKHVDKLLQEFSHIALAKRADGFQRPSWR